MKWRFCIQLNTLSFPAFPFQQNFLSIGLLYTDVATKCSSFRYSNCSLNTHFSWANFIIFRPHITGRKIIICIAFFIFRPHIMGEENHDLCCVLFHKICQISPRSWLFFIVFWLIQLVRLWNFCKNMSPLFIVLNNFFKPFCTSVRRVKWSKADDFANYFSDKISKIGKHLTELCRSNRRSW